MANSMKYFSEYTLRLHTANVLVYCIDNLDYCRCVYRRIITYAWFVACIMNERIDSTYITVFSILVYVDSYFIWHFLIHGEFPLMNRKAIDFSAFSSVNNQDELYVLMVALCFKVFIDKLLLGYIWGIWNDHTQNTIVLDSLVQTAILNF